MAKGSGTTRTSGAGGGYRTGAYGETITPLNRNILFDNYRVQAAIHDIYPQLSTGSNGNNLTFSSRSPYDAKSVVEDIKKLVSVEKKSYEDAGGGQYNLDTDIGGAQVLNESDQFVRQYSVLAWDENFKTGQRRMFATLNAAKDWGREQILTMYRDNHR